MAHKAVHVNTSREADGPINSVWQLTGDISACDGPIMINIFLSLHQDSPNHTIYKLQP